MIVFFLSIIIAINKCVYLFELVSQVSNVAHGPLVGFFLRKKNLCKRTLYCHEVSKIPHHFTNQEFFFQVVKNFVIFLKKLNLEFLCKHKGWVLKIKSSKVFQTIKSSMTIWYKRPDIYFKSSNGGSNNFDAKDAKPST